MAQHEQRTVPIVLVGMLPPPLTGQSLGFDLIVRSLRQEGFVCHVVNLTGSGRPFEGTARILRFVEYAGILADYARKVIGRRRTVYLMISQSRKGFLRDVVMIWLGRMLGHRIVCQLRGGNYDGFYASQPRPLRGLIRSTLLRTDVILVLGELLRAEFAFEPRLADRIHVVSNGLPDPRDVRPAPKRLPRPGEGPVHLLYLSNLVETKGYFDVLEAVDILDREMGLEVVCRFHGEFLANPADDVHITSADQARRRFDEYVERRGLSGRAIFGGVVRGAEKIHELRRAHFFLLPTAYIYEGQPVSIIEAMAYGCVVVSTRYRAIPELVEDGTTGVLVPYNEPRRIAEAVAALIADERRFEAMSEAAMERFDEHFSAERHIARLKEFLLPDEGRAPAS